MLRGNKGTTFLLEKIDVSTDEIAQLAIAKKLPVIFNAESKKVESQKSSEVKAVKFDKKASPVTTDNIWLSMFKPKTQAITSKKGRVAIIFPAQLGTQQDYFDLIDGIYTISNGKVKSYAPSLSRFDWPVSCSLHTINSS